MDKDLVVARHAADDLLALEIDRNDVVERHLVEPDGGGLHQEAAGVVRQSHGHMASNEIALILAGEHAASIGELPPERLGHCACLLDGPISVALPCPANFTSLSKTTCEAGIPKTHARNRNEE